MAQYPYLLKYLQKGERILLYGRGANGVGIYQYLKDQAFSVIGFIDQYPEPFSAAVPVYPPDRLKRSPSLEFDKIVITVTDNSVGRAIYKIVQESEVPLHKIVAPYICLETASVCPIEEFLSNPAFIQEEIHTFIKGEYRDFHFFDPWVECFKSHKSERDALVPRIQKAVRNLSPLEAVVFLDILYLSDLFQAELMEDIMNCLLQIDAVELRQFLYSGFLDTRIMCFHHPEYLFPAFYTMRRELLKKICEMNSFSVPLEREKKLSSDCIQKICILHNGFRPSKANADASILWCVQLSNMLVKMGYSVQIITLDPHSYLKETPVAPPFSFQLYDTSTDYLEGFRKDFLPEISLESSDKYDWKDRMQELLDKLFAYDPDLIMDMSNEYSILSYVYSQYYRTLYMPVGGYQSSSFFTYFLRMDQESFTKMNKIFCTIPETKAVDFQSCIIMPPSAQATYSREQYALSKDDFVMVTVGHRLDWELSKDFIDIVCKKLTEQLNLKWLVVGKENTYLSGKYQNLLAQKKIILISYENDLPALYKICNVYLNPERQGGATSFCWAMRDIPLAMVRMACDQAGIVGLDNMIDGTYEDVMDYVLKMQRNPDFYQAERRKFRKQIVAVENRRIKATRELINELNNRSVDP